MIKKGEKVPAVKISAVSNGEVSNLGLDELVAGKKVVLFATARGFYANLFGFTSTRLCRECGSDSGKGGGYDCLPFRE